MLSSSWSRRSFSTSAFKSKRNACIATLSAWPGSRHIYIVLTEEEVKSGGDQHSDLSRPFGSNLLHACDARSGHTIERWLPCSTRKSFKASTATAIVRRSDTQRQFFWTRDRKIASVKSAISLLVVLKLERTYLLCSMITLAMRTRQESAIYSSSSWI